MPAQPAAGEAVTLDPARVAAAVHAADLRVLLMVLFHVTGDRKWLQAPYRPRRDVQLIADEDGGLPAEVQDDIRRAATEILSRPGFVPAITDPGDTLMQEMMSVCLGEAVPDEYAPMMRQQMGLMPRAEDLPPAPRKLAAGQLPVLVVGAGASGIAMGATLLDLGIPFTIVEKNAEVGGTWLENRYPGCGVDTPNHAYSFSWGERYPWSRYFAPREQLHDYLVRSADGFGLRPHIRFETSVTSARWDEAARCWHVGLRNPDGSSETVRAFALVSAIGQLSQISIPDIPGKDDFQGPIFHSAQWPEGLELTGKRVAIIGTGATSMQVVPTVVDEVARITVYQRSAQWARPIPRYHDPIGADAQWLLAEVPFYAAWFRFTMLWRYGDGLLPTLRKDPDWIHPERSLNRVNDRHRQQMADHIMAELEGRPDLIAKCMPTYPPYGKRILLDNGWFQAIRKPNAELVTDDIDRIVADGVVTRDGTHRPADVVVLATGFRIAQMAARLNITGRAGRSLAEEWAGDDPRAYLGIAVAGFPNLFVMQGPSTGLGHGGSAIFQSECQAHYIAVCLSRMLNEGIAAIEAKPEAQAAFVAMIDALHEQMIWTHPGMSTYYRNSRGRVVSVTPRRLVDHWTESREPDFNAFHLTPAGEELARAG
ncbi:MAG: NAD(P)/FAD-dependent oxidoreductase [Pseudomonadota bacterium]|nr:NAD(P)/FAD-dependent oxidoreductase [Pseudomonadota bacterium]